jgi:hypothetical protein
VLYGVSAPRLDASQLDALRAGTLRSAAVGEPRPSSARQEPTARQQRRLEPTRLEPRLQAVLEQVGAGRDTPGKLISAGDDAGEAMQALAELELMGLLGRGDGGRYVPRESLAGR